jgi:hypothetical protein
MKRALVLNGAVMGALTLFAGCAGSASRTAVVAQQFQTPTTSAASWVESANVSYVQATAADAKAAPASSVVPASYAAPPAAQAAPTTEGEAPVRVLALRYPHPDGRQDVARVELLTADVARQRERESSWLSRVEQALSSALPGVEWGPGIRQAKGLDLPVSELQGMLVEIEKRRAADGAQAAPWPSPGHVEVNGRRESVAYATIPALDALVERVDREGKVISYEGSATDLLVAVGRLAPPESEATTASASATAAQ